MPFTLLAEYADGSSDELRVPAEIWRDNAATVTKLLQNPKTLVRVTLDPYREIADADAANNAYPPRIGTERVKPGTGGGRFRRGGDGPNPMQKAREAEAKKKEAEAGKGDATGGNGG